MKKGGSGRKHFSSSTVPRKLGAGLRRARSLGKESHVPQEWACYYPLSALSLAGGDMWETWTQSKCRPGPVGAAAAVLRDDAIAPGNQDSAFSW